MKRQDRLFAVSTSCVDVHEFVHHRRTILACQTAASRLHVSTLHISPHSPGRSHGACRLLVDHIRVLQAHAIAVPRPEFEPHASWPCGDGHKARLVGVPRGLEAHVEVQGGQRSSTWHAERESIHDRLCSERRKNGTFYGIHCALMIVQDLAVRSCWAHGVKLLQSADQRN